MWLPVANYLLLGDQPLAAVSGNHSQTLAIGNDSSLAVQNHLGGLGH